MGIAMTIPTSIEAPVQARFNRAFNVGPLAGSMTTGIFLMGIGVGSLFAGPFSETFGRSAIYFSALTITMLFVVVKALAPSSGSAITFRFLCAFFASAPLTVASGTIGDIWRPEQIPFALPFATFCVYSGPILGPVIGAYLPVIGYQWADWISLIILATALMLVLLTQLETYGLGSNSKDIKSLSVHALQELV
jgi:MFS family permease